MRRIIIESPFGSPDWRCILDNIDYTRRCIADSLKRDEAPFASHLLYTQSGILNDHDPEERLLGMNVGLEWIGVAEAVVVYTDRGISPGMTRAMANANALGIPVEYRKLGEK